MFCLLKNIKTEDRRLKAEDRRKGEGVGEKGGMGDNKPPWLIDSKLHPGR